MRGDRESLDYTSYTCWTWPFVGSVNKPSVEAWWRVVVVEEDGDGFVVVVVVVVVAGNESKLNAAATKKGRNTAASTPPVSCVCQSCIVAKRRVKREKLDRI